MKIIEPSIEVKWPMPPSSIMRWIEEAGRTAYKSEDRINEDSAEMFIKKLVVSGHHSVLEHMIVSARIICDRGCSHELVRHRIGSFTQESTRYCCYAQDKFGKEITIIRPSTYDSWTLAAQEQWHLAMKVAEASYLNMIESGCSAQQARSVLPNSLKTEIFVTFNLREWLHFFELRDSPKAHPDMQVIAKMLHKEFIEKLPVIFG